MEENAKQREQLLEQQLNAHISREKEMELILGVLESSNKLLDYRLQKTNEELANANMIIAQYEARINELQNKANTDKNTK